MSDDVIIEETVIEMAERGARGRDGVTGDYIKTGHQPGSTGNVWKVAPLRPGSAYDSLSTYEGVVTQTTEATSFSIEVLGVNDGDGRVVLHANSSEPVDPRGFALGDVVIWHGRPTNPDAPAEGFDQWEMLGPAAGAAAEEDVLAGAGDGYVSPPTLGAWGQAARAQAGRVAFQGGAELVSASKPARIEYVDPTRIVATVRPADDHYRDGYVRHYTDHTVWEMRNLRGIYHAGLGADSWVLCSMTSVFAGLVVEHTNFVWDRIVGGTTNNGQIFSMFDAIFFGGRESDGAAAISALAGSGPGHSNYDQTTNALIPTGAVKNGAALTDGVDIQATFRPGEILNATQFDFIGNRVLNGPGGFKFADVNMLRRFGGGRQMTLNDEVQFVAAPAVGLTVAGGFNCIYRNANKMQARNKAGAVSAVQTVGLKDSHAFAFTDGVRITGWNDADGGRAFEIENPATYQPYRRNGVEQAFTSESQPLVIDEATGPKVRQYIRQGSGTFDAETGNLLSFVSFMQGVRANGA